MELLDMVRAYETLLEQKAKLEEATKANNAKIDQLKQEIAQQMIDEDCPSISTGGYKFSLTAKTSYSKRSEQELMESGADFFEALRAEGLGDIIKETVNARTLDSTIKAYVQERGELSENLAAVIKPYDYTDISRRKETNKATRKARKE